MLGPRDVPSPLLVPGLVTLVLALAPPLGCGDGQGETGGSSNTTGGSGGSTSSTAGSGGDDTTTSTTTPTTTSSTTTPTTGTMAFPCTRVVPKGPLVTDFDALDYSMRALGWWGTPDLATFWGGLFVYGPTLTGDSMSGAFVLSGTVSGYSGFGTWFGNCTDASEYDGIRFKVSGDAGGKLQVWIMTNATFPITPADMRGACEYSSEATKYSDCVYPHTFVDVPAGGGEITLSWSDFAGGVPVAAVEPKELLGIQWSFDWSEGKAPYPASLTVDDVMLLLPGGGAGGAGGAAGSGSGGG